MGGENAGARSVAPGRDPTRIERAETGLPATPDLPRYPRELKLPVEAMTRVRLHNRGVAHVMDYVRAEVPVDRRSYLRRPGDNTPPLEVAVTFPTHGARTNYVARIPEAMTDCPGVRKIVKGCWQCERCFLPDVE